MAKAKKKKNKRAKKAEKTVAAKRTAKKAGRKSAKRSVKKAAKKTVRKTAKKTAKKAVTKTAKKSAKKAVPKATKKAAKKAAPKKTPAGKVDHAFFGELDISALDNDDVIWEREFSLGDATFEVHLWATPGEPPKMRMLDAFAALLEDLPSLDAHARQLLRQKFQQDRSYIEFHVEELDTAVIRALAPHGDASAVDVDAFVSAMELTEIGLWLLSDAEVASGPVVMDYMIDKENSDQILAVKLMETSQPVSIDWES